MTDELRSKLKAAHADEIEDISKYKQLSSMCNNDHYAGVLMDIACEEETHACLLAEMLGMEAHA